MKIKFLPAIIIFVSFFMFFGCSTAINASLQKDFSGSIALHTAVSHTVTSLTSSFFGTDETLNIFDLAQIQKSLEESGLKVTGLSCPSANSLAVFANTDDFSKILPEDNNFIKFSKSGSVSTMKLLLSPENIQKVVALMPDETAVYTDLLVAPVFTGEEMSEEEYIELMAIAYGGQAAAELAASEVKLQFAIPGKVKSCSISNPSFGTVKTENNNIMITIPLIHILTDLNENECVINWTE